MGKIRMTAQSKVDIEAAASAHIESYNDGYKLVLKGKSGKEVDVETGLGQPAEYPSMAAAKKAALRHNPKLFQDIALKPRI